MIQRMRVRVRVCVYAGVDTGLDRTRWRRFCWNMQRCWMQLWSEVLIQCVERYATERYFITYFRALALCLEWVNGS